MLWLTAGTMGNKNKLHRRPQRGEAATTKDAVWAYRLAGCNREFDARPITEYTRDAYAPVPVAYRFAVESSPDTGGTPMLLCPCRRVCGHRYLTLGLENVEVRRVVF